MNRDKTTPPVLIDLGARADEVDPWSEFLSESGDGAPQSDTSPVNAPEDAFEAESDLTGSAGSQASSVTAPVPLAESEAPDDAPGRDESPAVETAWSAARAEPAQDDDGNESDVPAAAPPSRVVRFSPAPGSLSREPDAPAWDMYRPGRDREPAPADERQPERVPHRVLPAGGSGHAPAAAAARLEDPAAVSVVRDASVSLADVLARRTTIRPAEAVAAIQELCTVLTDPARPTALVPDPRDVLLSPSGVVSIRPGAKGDRDARSLSRMLHALLSSANPPLPLRLFVTSAITSERYRSLSLFAEALSHYGSQNRGELIRGLYRRTRETPVPTDMPEGVGQPIVPRLARVKGAGMGRRLLGVAAGAALMLGGAAGMWLWQSTRAPVVGDPPAAGGESRTTEVRRAALVRDEWQIGQVSVPEDPPPPVPQPRPAPARPRPSAPPLQSSPLPAAMSLPVIAPPPAESVRPEPAVPAPLASRRPAAPNAARTDAQLDPRIYSREHLDVQPPTLLPSQPLAIRPTLAENTTNSLELLIDEQGVVQRARLRNRPQRFSDVSLLSQAKMLKFRPAVRNGSPVKYLLELDSLGSSD
jgi:protein TonB